MNKLYIALIGMAIIAQIGAMDQAKKPLVGKSEVVETIDDNNRLVRIDAQGKVIKESHGQEFMLYRINNDYVLPSTAATTGVLAFASLITMDPSLITAAGISGVLSFTSGMIKGTQLIENHCKKCKPAEDDIV